MGSSKRILGFNFRVSFVVIDIEEGVRELHHHHHHHGGRDEALPGSSPHLQEASGLVKPTSDEAVPGDTHEAGSCPDYLISQYTHHPLHLCASTPCIFEYTFLARHVELSPK